MNAPQARAKVSMALRKGHLTRQPCEECGTDVAVEAHHEDYSRPLDVRWLCRPHHRKLHRKNAPPSMFLRANISRAELGQLKAAAALAGLSLQDFLAQLIRQRITTREG